MGHSEHVSQGFFPLPRVYAITHLLTGRISLENHC